MALPSQIGFYRQHMDAFDLADVNPSGVEVRFDTKAKAIRWRQLAYTARKIYVERTGDESKWAGIMISLREADGEWILHVAHAASDALSITPLDGVLPERSSLDEHLAVITGRPEPFGLQPEPYVRPLGRTTVKPSPLTDDEIGEISFDLPPAPTGGLIE